MGVLEWLRPAQEALVGKNVVGAHRSAEASPGARWGAWESSVGGQAGAGARGIAVASVEEAEEEIVLTRTDEWMFKYLGRRSPVVPGGCFVTAAILLSGFRQFNKGNDPKRANQIMRARVVAQAITVGLMMTSLNVQKKQENYNRQQARLGLPAYNTVGSF